MNGRNLICGLLLAVCVGMLSACWGYVGLYYGDPDPEPPFDHVTPPEYDLVGTYRLRGFDVDYYAYDTGMYLGSAHEGSFSFSGKMEIGSSTFYQTIYMDGELHFTMNDYYEVFYTERPYEGIFDLFYNYDGESDYDDISFTCAGYDLITFSLICSPLRGLCWEEWDYWEKVSDWL